jgi:hypothetical protein
VVQGQNKPGVREHITINFDETALRLRNPRPGELDKLSDIEQTAKMIELREIPFDKIPKETLDQIPKATLDRIKHSINGKLFNVFNGPYALQGLDRIFHEFLLRVRKTLRLPRRVSRMRGENLGVLTYKQYVSAGVR